MEILILVFYLFLFVLAVLWFILPFLIYGINEKTKEVVSLLHGIREEAGEINEFLSAILRKLPEQKKKYGDPD